VWDTGGSAMRGDLFVRRPRQAKDEVLAVLEEEDEHQAQQGSYSFPCTSTHSVENHQRVSSFSQDSFQEERAFSFVKVCSWSEEEEEDIYKP